MKSVLNASDAFELRVITGATLVWGTADHHQILMNAIAFSRHIPKTTMTPIVKNMSWRVIGSD